MLDQLAKASIEIAADNWRDVYPAGWTYHSEILETLTAERVAGRISGDQAAALFVAVGQYVNKESAELDLSASASLR